MPQHNLLDFLTGIIAEQLQQQTKPSAHPQPGQRGGGLYTTRGTHPSVFKAGPAATNLPRPRQPADTTLAHKIAANLLEQALRANLPFDFNHISQTQLKGGNTAGAVVQVTLHLPFVFKFEVNDDTVKKEALTMRGIKNNPALAQDFRDAWATVYAIVDDGPPYGYLMEFFPEEDGWRSLEKHLYAKVRPSDNSAIEWINAALNIMFSGYASGIVKRSRPNLPADYGERLARLPKAAEENRNQGQLFASRPLRVNGTLYKPWREYLALLARHAGYLNQITPDFATVVHGDPNPGNFMLKSDSGKLRVKLIDPKDWEHGDYVLDIAKLSHFLQVIGPVEYALPDQGPALTCCENGDELALEYALPLSAGIKIALDGAMEKLRQFAEQQGDSAWEARYELAMAANLLGLPVGRLKKERLEDALIFLAEGIIWLDRFCARLEPGFRHSKYVYYAPADTLQPDSFQQGRAWVLQQIADASLGQDLSGAQRLEWHFTPATAATIPCALAFEHKAHLCCGPGLNIGTLQNTLAERARTMQPFLSDDNYRSWRIARCEQDLPIIRRYYDHAESGAALIRRQISLVETVASASHTQEWKLELPYIALGASGIRARQFFQWGRDWEAEMDWQETLAIYKNPLEAAQWAHHPLALAAVRLEIGIDKLRPILQQSTYRESYLAKDAMDQAKFAIHVDHVMVQDLHSGRVGTFAEIQIDSMGEMNRDDLAQFARFVAALVKEYGLQHAPHTRAQSGIGVVGMH